MWQLVLNIIGSVLMVITLAIWRIMFCYFIPKLADNRFEQIASVAFGVWGMVPMLLVVGSLVYRAVLGKKPKPIEVERCPHCGQQLPPRF